jgi:hypothetical protein
MIELVQTGLRRSSFQLLKPYFRSLPSLYHLKPLNEDLPQDRYITRDPHAMLHISHRRHSFPSSQSYQESRQLTVNAVRVSTQWHISCRTLLSTEGSDARNLGDR